MGVAHYFTGRLCKRGHLSPRYTANKNCVECNRLWNLEQAETQRKYSRRWYLKNKALNNQRSKAYAKANPDRVAAMGAWTSARRRGADLHPDFASSTEVLDATVPFYAEARRLTAETGKRYVVDHVVALVAGGAHHPDNLQILSAYENAKKAVEVDIPLAKSLREQGLLPTTPELEDLDYDEQECAEIEAAQQQQGERL